MSQAQRALIVDDDPGIRNLISTILRRENFEVETAADGHEAIERFGQSRFDVVLLDLMMPRVDGAGVMAWLERHHPDAARRVVMMTAFSNSARQRIGFACPIVSKPFDVPQLVETVRERMSTH